jgi:hypothetical protein
VNIEIQDAPLAANPAVDPFASWIGYGQEREEESLILPIFKVKRPDSSAKGEPKVK